MFSDRTVVSALISIFASTGVYIESIEVWRVTLFHILIPFAFTIGLIKTKYKRLKYFNLRFFFAIAVFAIFLAFNSTSLSSAGNIILLAVGFLGVYAIYENLDFMDRKKSVIFVLRMLFLQSCIELVLKFFFVEVDHVIYPTLGRVDGWATEPSHFTFIVMLTITAYVISFDIPGKQAVKMFGMFAPAVYFSTSAYGYLFAALSALTLASHYRARTSRRVSNQHFPMLISISGVALVVLLMPDITQRITSTISGIIYYDFAMMDRNSFVRLLPFFVLIESFHEFSIVEMVFGHGLGSSEYFVRHIVGLPTDYGHLASFTYDFGLFGLLWLLALFVLVIGKLKRKVFVVLSIFIMLFNMNVGTQVFWYTIFMLAVIRLEERNFKEESRVVVAKTHAHGRGQTVMRAKEPIDSGYS